MAPDKIRRPGDDSPIRRHMSKNLVEVVEMLSFIEPKKVAIVVSTCLIVTVSSWSQERISRTEGLARESLVLAETGAYVFGTLVVAFCTGGWTKLRKCIDFNQYLLFMPVSLAFLASNFLTYTAVEGLGASQFFMLSQLRVAISAVLLRVLKGVEQSMAEWIALLQLSIGLLLLVHLQLSAGTTDPRLAGGVGAPSASLLYYQIMGFDEPICPRRPYPWVPKQGRCWDAERPGRSAASMEFLSMAAAAGADVLDAADSPDLTKPLMALVGVLFSSAFAFIYMESQLKSRPGTSITVQLHQLNFCGATASLLINVYKFSSASSAVDLLAGWNIYVVGYWVIQVSRGVMCSVILKVFDTVVKGLTDIAAMVGVCILQIVFDGQTIDKTRIGLQLLLLLSILTYLSARGMQHELKALKLMSGRKSQ